jgi:transglutaminase-like putative cysteine protease
MSPDAGSTAPAWRIGAPLLAMSAGWVALFAWSGMVTQPLGFLVPTLIVGLMMTFAGSGLRLLHVPAYGVAAVQLLIAMFSLNVLFAARQSLLVVVPTEASVRRVVYVLHNGAATLNHYASPVEVNPVHTRAVLMACGLAVLLAMDVLAMGVRRPSLAALPLLVTLSVPVSILQNAIALPVFVGTALLFLRLLATEHLDTFRGWAGTRPTSGVVDSGARRPVLSTMWQASIGAVLVALLVAPIVPVTDLLKHDKTPGEGTGAGGSYELDAVNPFIRLRRDLVEKTHTPLVYARTKARSTAYLRTTVLDQFTSDEWRPSPRNLPTQNKADGPFPSAPGLSPSVGGTVDPWSFQLAPEFTTTWLPLPYPVREVQVPGNWRYDARTLDVAYAGDGAPPALRYSATAFTPAITASLLDDTVKAPKDIRTPMTRVPADLPQVIRTRAREVTADAKGDFAKTVALQDWFREGGNFRYSLQQRSGSGMDLLAHFVTDDRVGYCEQFAAAMAAMGRVLGIPSRVVVGFLDGTPQKDGQILYTSDDRHAWPEMYFTGVGWVRFEPTPGQRAGATPEWTRQDVSAAQPSAAPSAATSQSAAAKPDTTPVDTTTTSHQGSTIPWWPAAALLVVLVLGLAPGLVRRVQRRRRLSPANGVHLAEGAWAELHATALDLGLDWPEERSPREQARRVVDQVEAADQDLGSLEGLLRRVERGRYARAGGVGTVEPEVRAQTVETVESWRRVMIDSVDRERGWRGRLWPVSLLRRGRAQ